MHLSSCSFVLTVTYCQGREHPHRCFRSRQNPFQRRLADSGLRHSPGHEMGLDQHVQPVSDGDRIGPPHTVPARLAKDAYPDAAEDPQRSVPGRAGEVGSTGR